MKDLIRAFGNFNVEQVIVFCSAIYGLYKVLEKIYKAVTGFHDKQQESDHIIKVVKENTIKINRLAQTINELVASDREYKLRSLADKLFVCYNIAKQQGYITRRQLENFHANLVTYYGLGGNGLVAKKYEPEVNEMEVRED